MNLRLTTIAAFGFFFFPLGMSPSVWAQGKPTAESILRQIQAALGGEEALRSIDNVKISIAETLHAKDDNRQRITESTSTLYAAGNKWIVNSSLGTSRGFDGKRSWSKGKQGPVRWTDQRYPFQNVDPIFYSLHVAEFPGTLTYTGTEVISGGEVHILKTELEQPEPDRKIQMAPAEFHFDTSNGLLVRIIHEVQTVEFSAYSVVDGFMVAHLIRTTTDLGDLKAESIRQVIDIELNVKMPDDLFSPAAER